MKYEISAEELKQKLVFDRENREVGRIKKVEKVAATEEIKGLRMELEPRIGRMFHPGIEEVPLDMSDVKSFDKNIILSKTLNELNKKWNQNIRIRNSIYHPSDILGKTVFDRNKDRIGVIKDIFHSPEDNGTIRIRLVPTIRREYMMSGVSDVRIDLNRIKNVGNSITLDRNVSELRAGWIEITED